MAEWIINTIEEWNDKISEGRSHRDIDVYLNLAPDMPAYVTQAHYRRLIACGKTHIIVDVAEEMEVIIKDNAAALIRKGELTAKGKSVCTAVGESKVRATNRAVVYAFDEAKIECAQCSICYAFDEAQVTAAGQSVCFLGDYTSFAGEDEATAVNFLTTGSIITKNSARIKRGWNQSKYIRGKKTAFADFPDY